MQTSVRTTASLIGRYRVEVRSTVGAVRGTPERAEWDMVLQRPDSARLLATRSSPERSVRANRQLVGTRHRAGSHTTDPVAWIEGLLRIGCDCDQGARDLLLIERLDRDGFRGSWMRLPDPERDRSPWVSGPTTDAPPGTEGASIPTGYFCAVRVRE